MFNKSPSPSETPIISVSELNAFARGVLEMQVGRIKVMGEISNLSRPASGHWYFTLKDQGAQIRCAMFRGRNQLIRHKVDNGMQIIVHGSVSLYEPRGDYQLIADYLEDAGMGNLQQRFEKLKQQLLQEGLFSPQYKKTISKNLQHIAVITSATGAAVQDILQVFNKRYPLMKLTVIPAVVQGDTAVASLCSALEKIEHWNKANTTEAFDAVIIGRGGGSIEDLWAFNEEKLARAIFACSIPVVSAVGHETDTTIADFVADLRAPTPSAAAEMLSPDIEDIYQRLDYQELKIQQRIEQKIKHQVALLNGLRLSLKHPTQQLEHWHSQFRLLQTQLQQAINKQLQGKSHQVTLLAPHFKPALLDDATNQHKLFLETLQHKLLRNMHTTLHSKQIQWKNKAEVLNSVSPLRTLQRGYSISRSKQQDIIRKVDQVSVGDVIETTVADGIISSQITQIENT